MPAITIGSDFEGIGHRVPHSRAVSSASRTDRASIARLNLTGVMAGP